MTALLVHYYVHYSLRRYPLFVLMCGSEMGAHRSPGCTARDSYSGEEEDGELDECSDLSFLHIGIRCPFTLMITLIEG